MLFTIVQLVKSVVSVDGMLDYQEVFFSLHLWMSIFILVLCILLTVRPLQGFIL